MEVQANFRLTGGRPIIDEVDTGTFVTWEEQLGIPGLVLGARMRVTDCTELIHAFPLIASQAGPLLQGKQCA